MAEEIDVSFVMTVYNKEFYLPSVIKTRNSFSSTTFQATIQSKLSGG